MTDLSGFNIMKRLLIELKPLTKYMAMTIILGVLGFLSAISIASFAAIAAVDVLGQGIGVTFKLAIGVVIIGALLRGPLRYAEQLCGHYIAFKILAILRDKVFAALRRLSPAKLEGKEKGNLVALVTSDIELLEVFYAHTIAPVSIAVITNSIISGVLYSIHPLFGGISAVFFLIVGLALPYFSSRIGKTAGIEYRQELGISNSYLLDSLRGLREVLIFNNGIRRAKEIQGASQRLNERQARLKLHEGITRAVTDLFIMLAILSFLIVGRNLLLADDISFGNLVVAIAVIASSFGPVAALSSLSNTLLQTFASAQRLFNLLDEEPEVLEVPGECSLPHLDMQCKNASFGYTDREAILEDISVTIAQGERIAIVGESGTGKSTFAKLLMRFWDSSKGEITLGDVKLAALPTNTLRANQALMGQETYLFHGTIEDNIKMGDLKANREEIIKAAKKASIHDFIMSLPHNYDTKVGELGSNFSSGERQRIGLARAFIKKADILILDEPTSNLDTLNEKEILKAITANAEDRTILLITHRKSTASICEKILKIEKKKIV